jgi:hypothetical protein
MQNSGQSGYQFANIQMNQNPVRFLESSSEQLRDSLCDDKSYENIFIMKYGSDPLKTYLPDSDIDVTIIVNNNFRSVSTGKLEFVPPLSQLKMIK